ncbi:MAG: helix-turn-helix transcriptional regulator [Oscillochloris sp.]|nr:helix-turn-helix transcriptional regulator [Oscillochloris sp.]
MSATPDTLRTIAGQRIRDLRRAQGLSAADLAAALGWPLDTLLNYEYGRRPLQLDRLEAIAAQLSVSPLALLIADAETAALIARLAGDAALAREVQFFIDALAAELRQSGGEGR